MASAAAEAAPLHHGLPDEIIVWEILVRLPPESVLRCRAVCSAWRRATTTGDFLLAHHARQPTFPLLIAYEYGVYNESSMFLDIIPLDHRAGLTAAADRCRSVARLDHAIFEVEASCDGLLVVSIGGTQFAICNPATREYAPLPLLHGFMVLGMYPCTGEYRLLLKPDSMYDGPDAQEDCYHVFTLGSGEPPRHIGCPDAERPEHGVVSVLLHGCLHRYTGNMSLHRYTSNMIMVFDTTVESFRQMRSPVPSGIVYGVGSSDTRLFEIGGMLGMSSRGDGGKVMDIWVMHDYQGEVWAFSRRVELPLAEFGVPLRSYEKHWSVVVASWDGDLLLLVKFGKWVFQVDMDGRLVAGFHHRGHLIPSEHRLKQSLIQHGFFPTLDKRTMEDLFLGPGCSRAVNLSGVDRRGGVQRNHIYYSMQNYKLHDGLQDPDCIATLDLGSFFFETWGKSFVAVFVAGWLVLSALTLLFWCWRLAIIFGRVRSVSSKSQVFSPM